MTRNAVLLVAIAAVFIGGVSSQGSGSFVPSGSGAGAVKPYYEDSNFNPGDQYKIVPLKKPDQIHRIVSNQQNAYVIYPAQTHGNQYFYDPWTIGQVLGYLYELAEFGPNPPPNFQYTIDLFGLGPAPKYGKKKRSAQKLRRATLVFTKKEKKSAPPPEPKKSVLSEEDKYWDGVLDNVWEDDMS